MALEEYKRKRNFKQTPEPEGKPKPAAEQFFVVQKHAASRLHYDFRLAMDGVLKSWAVPKGFPFEQGDKRLAVHVEDHPIDYANFEGTIAPGNYGAGTVMIWDRGQYEVSGENPARAVHKGKLHLKLSGKKLKGEWTLVRIRNPKDESKENWLIMKTGASAKPPSKRADDQSALTQRSMDQIASDNDAQWESNRKADTPQTLAKPSSPRGKAPAPTPEPDLGKVANLPKSRPKFIPPMKALLKDILPEGDEWIYEIKFDGIRALALKDKGKISVYSRNAKLQDFPEITSAIEGLPLEDGILDGEIVALDEHGRPSFQLLQGRHLRAGARPPIFYYVFDLLNLNGHQLVDLPLAKRKELLESLLASPPERIRYSGNIQARSQRVISTMKQQGLEGIIAKKIHSKYEPNSRSGAWIKFKWTHTQEFVIGGFTKPEGARSHFGAILVGFYKNKDLIFASKVGTGFNQQLLKSLHDRFEELATPHCPFKNLPEKRSGRSGQGITAAAMKQCTWVKPKLVCQIKFTEWTRDDHLRHPVFLGLRQDKAPEEVVQECPA